MAWRPRKRYDKSDGWHDQEHARGMTRVMVGMTKNMQELHPATEPVQDKNEVAYRYSKK